MKNTILFLAALACAIAACVAPDSPSRELVTLPICPTPSECPFVQFGCDPDWDSTQLVWLDYEPSPWGPEVIECCPLFPGKAPAQAAGICAYLDTDLTPWQLRVWSDSVTLQKALPGNPLPYFCMDEYWGNWYAYFSGDTLKIDLRDYWQVKHYLDTQEQIQFVVGIRCPD
ncbi:MAG: hypothetical protein AAB316_00760 [Bacteroidota bacterium]